MNHYFAKRPSLLSTRVTAVAAAFLVLALVVFSASPVLHAWLHGRDGASVSATTTAANHTGQDQSKPDQDQDDACAVVMFAQGILAVIFAFILCAALRRVIEFSVSYVAAIYRATPRYWLPPLCGPPLN